MSNPPDWPSYLSALLAMPDSSIGREIGTRLEALHEDSDRISDYITQLMTENQSGTREYEIAWDICALRVGLVAA